MQISPFKKVKLIPLMLKGGIAFVLLFVFFIFIELYLPFLSEQSKDPLFNVLLQCILFLLLFYTLKKKEVSLKDMLGPTGWKDSGLIKWASLELLFLFVSLTFVGALVNIVLHSVSLTTIEDFIMKEVAEPSLADFPPFWLVVTAGIVAPVVEEFAFRGLLINKWGETMGVTKALFLSSFIFSVLHFQLFLPQFMSGLVFGIAYIKTKKLWVPILLHALNNMLVISFLIMPGGDAGEEVVLLPGDVAEFFSEFLSEIKSFLNVTSVLFVFSFVITVYIFVKQLKSLPTETPYQWNRKKQTEKIDEGIVYE